MTLIALRSDVSTPPAPHTGCFSLPFYSVWVHRPLDSTDHICGGGFLLGYSSIHQSSQTHAQVYSSNPPGTSQLSQDDSQISPHICQVVWMPSFSGLTFLFDRRLGDCKNSLRNRAHKVYRVVFLYKTVIYTRDIAGYGMVQSTKH